MFGSKMKTPQGNVKIVARERSDGNVYCWLCLRAIGNHPDTFNAIFIEGDEDPKAICDRGCRDKANILIKKKFKIAAGDA